MLSHLWNNLRKGTKTFRKRVGCYNYKHKGYTHTHKRPGSVDVKTRDELYKLKTLEAAQKIRELEKRGGRIFGTWDSFGNFKIDKSKIPKFDIPDLDGFELKPYVSYQTPKISVELREQIKELYDYKKQHNLLQQNDKDKIQSQQLI